MLLIFLVYKMCLHRNIPTIYIFAGGRRAESSWLKVHADQEYVLTVDLRRINTEKVSTCMGYASVYLKRYLL